MKKILLGFLLILFSVSAHAEPASILGGEPLATPTAHYVGVGWPSLKYEYWHAGNGRADWAVGGELVYGDWSGNYSDVTIGGALNVPIRWHLYNSREINMSFQFTPGGLAATVSTPGDDSFVGGLRADVGLPVSVKLNHQVRLITGVTAPLTMLFVEHGDTAGIIPILFRLGAEVEVEDKISPSLLVEVGPTIGVTKNNTDVDVGFRVFAGVAF